MAYSIVLDVGGTQIKAAALDEHASLLWEIQSFPTLAQSSQEVIWGQLIRAISAPVESLVSARGLPQGVAMTFPGPFVFEEGVSLMRGLRKFDAIYGMSVPKALRERLSPWKLETVPLLFLHDMEAFALGMCRHTEAGRHERVMYLCIGTGAGSAFTENRQVLKGEIPGLPYNGWIYRTPMLGQTIDDIISARGLEALAEGLCHEPLDGAALSQRAARGDPLALAAWRAFGERVARAVMPFLEAFQAQALVLGGQITKGHPYFGAQVEAACQAREVRLYYCADTSFRAMQGLWTALDEKRPSERKDLP